MKFIILITITLIAFSACKKDRLINDRDFIKKVNLKASTWFAGENEKFNGLKISDAKKFTGAIIHSSHPLIKTKPAEYHQDVTLEHFDLRKAYPDCESLQLIRDQSMCDSCWAVAAAEIASDRICIASKGQYQPLISAFHLMSCCLECTGTTDGCNPGNTNAAMAYWFSNGIPTGGNYQDFQTCQPYPFPPCSGNVTIENNPKICPSMFDAPTSQCSETCNSQYKTNSVNNDRWFANDVYNVDSSVEAIQAEILQNGSVEAAFTVYEDFMNYKSGVYQHVTGPAVGGHAIRLVGWGVENGVEYWQGINSWNIWWGENGTFKIRRGVNECGIESGIVAGIPLLTPPEDN